MEHQQEKTSTPGTPTKLPAMKPSWQIALFAGIPFWIAAIALWLQKGIDERLLFFFNPARIEYSPLIWLSELLSDYGIAAITIIYIIYFLAALKFKQLDAPLTIYLFLVLSLSLSGVAGNLLKELFARPRPFTTYAEQIFVYSDSSSYSIPSGHATQSAALILPFIVYVSSRSRLHRMLKIVLITLTFSILLSRITLGEHYLSDVLGGLGTACIGLPFAIFFSRSNLKDTTQDELPMLSKIWWVLLLVVVGIFSL
jgi:undecaprenyl-diphosphatase